jgi:hypothetical protein
VPFVFFLLFVLKIGVRAPAEPSSSAPDFLAQVCVNPR